MKKFILLTTALATVTISSFSQSNGSSTAAQSANSVNSYLLKAKKQRTAAWVCLGGGLAMVTTAAVVGATKATEDIISTMVWDTPQNTYTGETILLVAGGAAIVASIPLFIGASRNQHKATLKITDQKTAIGIPIAVPKKITGLTLSISI